MRLALAFLSLSIPCLAATLTQKINALAGSSQPARQTFWGIHVVDARTGATVYRRNEANFFIPASNAKLFSTSLALMRLGPKYLFETIVTAEAPPDSNGRVSEIRLVGGGDPNLSARVIPYQRNETKPNPFEAIDRLADAVVAAGVKVVDGDVVGDDTAYYWEPYPDGWAIDDAAWEYGAAVSALTLNDNAFLMRVDPAGETGQPAQLTLSPELEHLTIHNRTVTGVSGPTKISIARLPGSPELTVSGAIDVNGKASENLLAVNDPAEFAAYAFRDALLRRGVQVAGTARAAHRREGEPPPGSFRQVLARHISEPLIEGLRIINKVSQNLHAEMVLREVARAKDGVGSRKRGLEELGSFLKEIGVPDKQYNFEDGSGLSRLTLVTPATITKLLTFMYGTPYRDAWVETLPIAGEDGTLYARFEQTPRRGIRAKTGTISHVSALSGYALRKDGRRYAFSIVANNYNADAATIRKLIDRMAITLIQ
jgi:serine-type D-Ala-D-Ala carboxypeptidase/endopeptidase (penicillin-binding protein 4)